MQKYDPVSSSIAESEEFAVATTESDVEAEVIFDDVFNSVIGVNNVVALGGTGVFGGAGNNDPGGELVGTATHVDSIRCFKTTITHLNATAYFPVRIVIDFGAGCVGRDGRTRKGKIVTEYSNRLMVPQAIATTTFIDYFINNIKVEGTHKISNRSTQDKRIFHVMIINSKLSNPAGDYSEWNSEKSFAQIEGIGTPQYPQDDVFIIKGGAKGSVKRGEKFFEWNTSIGEPLVKKFNCRWIIKGTINLQKSEKPVALLNYGNGDCDNKASFTVKGHTREITLP